MKLTESQAVELFLDEEIEVDGTKLTLVEEGDFKQDGKYQSADIIFTDGKDYYRTYITRAGSPFTDWEYIDYGDAVVDKVEKREITVTRWVTVKEAE